MTSTHHKTMLMALALLASGPALAEDCTYYSDSDGDGYGVSDDSLTTDCTTAPSGYVLIDGDCDDDDANVSPAEAELLDQVDNDCSGDIDDVDPTDATAAVEGSASVPLAAAHGIGDVDGDGTDELLVAFTDGFWVFSGADVFGTLTSADALVTVTGDVGGGLGTAVTHGDVDGDGKADVFVGEPGSDTVRVYIGDGWLTDGLETDTWTQSGGFGASLDLDEDTATLIVGAPSGNAVYIGTNLTTSVSWQTISSISDSIDNGTSVAIGDIYGADGLSDYIFGGPASSDPKPNEIDNTGMVYTRNNVGSCNWTWGGPYCQLIYGGSYDQSEVGTAVGFMGEVSGDSYGDWLGTAPAHFGGMGYAAVTAGESSVSNYHKGIESQVWVSVTGEGTSDRLGETVALGDLNGDGVTDLIVGASGAETAYVMLSDEGVLCSGRFGADELDATVVGSSAGDGTADGLSTGDFDGDGLDDIVVLASAGGSSGDGLVSIYTSEFPDPAVWADPRCVTDSDGDGIGDDEDVCPGGDDTVDGDGDGTPDDCDACPLDAYNDSDGDGFCDSDDVCPFDALDDADGDGLCADEDICPADADNDADADGICGDVDLCPADAQNDADGDGVCGDVDVCEGGDDTVDTDGDGTADFCDVCPDDYYNDSDGDGACDSDDVCPLDADDDIDGDGACADEDICPLDNPDDTDDDLVCDSDDPCPLDAENDADGDGICESSDNCDDVANSNQSDTDGDGIGDVCEPDTDGDGVIDDEDNCPFTSDPTQADADGDGEGDVCDADDDGDGVHDSEDACPATASGETVASDGCSVEDTCPCDGDWKNHGAYVRCVAKTTNDMVKEGTMTSAEKDATQSAAGESSCGK